MLEQASEKLKKGQSIVICPRGNSMTPKIKSGQKVKITPFDKMTLKKKNIVLCKVGNNYYLHLVKSVDFNKKRCLIGNNHGNINGWTTFDNIFGRKV